MAAGKSPVKQTELWVIQEEDIVYYFLPSNPYDKPQDANIVQSPYLLPLSGLDQILQRYYNII